VTKIDILDRAFQWTKDDEVAAWIKEAMAEIRYIRFCHGNVSKMLTEAAQIMDDQNKKIAKLKTEIDFERNMHQAEVNQLNDDIKFLRSKLPNL
jgi:hypothetical protein